jgi:hypothetical protein
VIERQKFSSAIFKSHHNFQSLDSVVDAVVRLHIAEKIRGNDGVWILSKIP